MSRSSIVRFAQVEMGLLIVSADDYGIAEGTSRGILDAHAHGVVTATSVLALGAAFKQTATWLQDYDRLDIGVHLASVGEDPPLLYAAEIPSLVDGRGRLSPSWRHFVAKASLGRVDPDDLHRELSAQIDAVCHEVGCVPTHLDAHQHLHLLPVVRDVVIRLARERGIRAVRVPRSRRLSGTGLAVRALGRALARRLTASTLIHTDDFAGLDEAGAMVTSRLACTIARLSREGAASAEICTHPGQPTGMERYRWHYRWAEELRALTAPAIRRLVGAEKLVLGTFGSLIATQRGSGS